MRLSIITVNLNNRDGLERTLKSVFEQTNRDFESIVIDGLSDDGSRELIEVQKGRIDKWVSEKDSGLFQAMNKGIRLAAGEYVLFLNSGDCLHSADALSRVFRHPFREDFVIFDVEIVKREGREIISLHKGPRDTLINGSLNHQAVLHKRALFQMLGLYNESYRLAADYELFLKAFFKAGCSYRIIPEVLCVFDCIHGLSSDPRNAGLLHDERRLAQRAVFDAEVVDALEAQHREIELLTTVKSRYEGLLQSGTVQTALRVSGGIQRIKRLFGRKTPVRENR